jgi:hypothetical protein
VGWKEKDKTHLGEELSDCLLYLVRLADKCDVNLAAAVGVPCPTHETMLTSAPFYHCSEPMQTSLTVVSVPSQKVGEKRSQVPFGQVQGEKVTQRPTV